MRLLPLIKFCKLNCVTFCTAKIVTSSRLVFLCIAKSSVCISPVLKNEKLREVSDKMVGVPASEAILPFIPWK